LRYNIHPKQQSTPQSTDTKGVGVEYFPNSKQFNTGTSYAEQSLASFCNRNEKNNNNNKNNNPNVGTNGDEKTIPKFLHVYI